MNSSRIKVLLATLVVLGASACGTATDPGDLVDADPAADPSPGTEVAAAEPRLAVTHDGGVMVVDVTSGDVVSEVNLDGFSRVSPAGDGRHVLVGTTGGWQVLDLGSWGHEHGDHGHHYTGDPGLTDVRFEAEEPGHVVSHDGVTTLFDDGTGAITVFDPEDLADGQPETSTTASDEPHHGAQP